MIIGSDQLNVAITFQLVIVHDVGLYVIDAVGAVMSGISSLRAYRLACVLVNSTYGVEPRTIHVFSNCQFDPFSPKILSSSELYMATISPLVLP